MGKKLQNKSLKDSYVMFLDHQFVYIAITIYLFSLFHAFYLHEHVTNREPGCIL